MRSSSSASFSAVAPPIDTPSSAICPGALVGLEPVDDARRSPASRTPWVVGRLALAVVAEVEEDEVVGVVEDRARSSMLLLLLPQPWAITTVGPVGPVPCRRDVPAGQPNVAGADGVAGRRALGGAVLGSASAGARHRSRCRN